MSDDEKKPGLKDIIPAGRLPDNLFHFVVGLPMPFPGALALPNDIETIEQPSAEQINRRGGRLVQEPFEIEGPPLDIATRAYMDEWVAAGQREARGGVAHYDERGNIVEIVYAPDTTEGQAVDPGQEACLEQWALANIARVAVLPLGTGDLAKKFRLPRDDDVDVKTLSEKFTSQEAEATLRAMLELMPGIAQRIGLAVNVGPEAAWVAIGDKRSLRAFAAALPIIAEVWRGEFGKPEIEGALGAVARDQAAHEKNLEMVIEMEQWKPDTLESFKVTISKKDLKEKP